MDGRKYYLYGDYEYSERQFLEINYKGSDLKAMRVRLTLPWKKQG